MSARIRKVVLWVVSRLVFVSTIWTIMCRATSPHYTRKIIPTQDKLAQNVIVFGTRSRSASFIKVEICLIKEP